MKKQFLLASVSIVAIALASAAYAGDNNQTNINQKGTGGSVTIDQGGNGNVAGVSGTTSSSVPTISNSLVQDGSNETLSVSFEPSWTSELLIVGAVLEEVPDTPATLPLPP